MFELQHAVSEVGKWANDLSPTRKDLLVRLARERLRRRYIARPDIQEKINKWTATEVVVSLLQHVTDSLTMELMLDLYESYNPIPQCDASDTVHEVK